MEGGEALEEYSEEKGEDTGEEKDRYLGRKDLFISRCGHDYEFEAKQVWVNLSKPTKALVESVREGLDSAIKEVNHSQVADSRKFGIVFAAPFFRDEEPPVIVSALDE